MGYTLYGGAEDYSMPNTLNAWAEYQPPTTYYTPVQNNYASQTTVKNRAPVIAPEFQAPSLAPVQAAQFQRLPDYAPYQGSAQTAATTPVGNMVPSVSGPGSDIVQLGPWSQLQAPVAETTPTVTGAGDANTPQQEQPTQIDTTNPSNFAPGLYRQLEQSASTPPRARGVQPAGLPEPLAPRMDAQDLKDIYEGVNNQMAQVPIKGLTRAQKLGFLLSPEARKMGMAKLAAEAKGRAEMQKRLIDDQIEVRKAEMAKELTAQQETQVIRDFINGSPEEREALLRRFPNLSYYKDIPQSRENSLAIAAKEAEHIGKIAGAAKDVFSLSWEKAQKENQEDQSRASAKSAQIAAQRSEATYESDVAQSKAQSTKSQVEADIATQTKQDKIDQERTNTQLKQWELANQPTEFMKNQQGLVAQYNDIMQKIQDGQMKLADGIIGMGSTLAKAAESAELSGDTEGAKRLRDSAMALFNMGAPLPEAVAVKKGEKPVPQPLNVTKVGLGAQAGGVSAQGGMMPPTPPTLTLQGGIEQRNVQQVHPGQQLFQVPPPPPMMPFPQGLPMAGGEQPAMGGGPAGRQAPGGGFVPAPPPGAVPPNLMQQYPQYGGAIPASVTPPLQGGVQQNAGGNPVAAFNQAMQPPAAQPQAAQAAPPQQPQPGFFESIGKQMQSGTGAPPMLGPNNPPQGLQRFALGGLALGKAYAHAVGSGIGGAINRAIPHMPPPEELKAQYEAQAVKNAERLRDTVVTPWVTPESRGFKRGAMLTDPELYNYFARKGRDSFTANELIKTAGWTLPPAGFNAGNSGAPQPMTPDYIRFKRRDDAGGVPLLPQPGDEAPYTQFDPKLLQGNLQRNVRRMPPMLPNQQNPEYQNHFPPTVEQRHEGVRQHPAYRDAFNKTFDPALLPQNMPRKGPPMLPSKEYREAFNTEFDPALLPENLRRNR